jgi:5'-nucleotidase
MRVLVTNDDGIDSPGLVVLAEMARYHGHDVLVAAPCWDSSGASSSVTGVSSLGEVGSESRSWPGWPEGSVLAVDGTPALITLVALHLKFGPRPDLVVSGINRGANTGRAILHSGTVGAAFTAFQHGCPALAVSLDLLDGATGDDLHWGTAGQVAGRVLDWMVADGRHLVVNCNVPNVSADRLLGIRQGRLDLLGTFQTSMTERSGGSVPLTVAEEEGVAVDSDTTLPSRGLASVTALLAVVEDTAVDFKGLVD